LLPASLRGRFHWWSWWMANTNVHSCLVTRGVKIYFSALENDRISTGRFRKLVLRIDFEEGRWPLCVLELGLRVLRTLRNVKSSCEGVDSISKTRIVFENKLHTNDALSFSDSFSLFLALSCGNVQNRFGPRLVDDGGTLFRN